MSLDVQMHSGWMQNDFMVCGASYSLGSIFYQYMVVFLFNTVISVFLLLGLCILIVWLP